MPKNSLVYLREQLATTEQPFDRHITGNYGEDQLRNEPMQLTLLGLELELQRLRRDGAKDSDLVMIDAIDTLDVVGATRGSAVIMLLTNAED